MPCGADGLLLGDAADRLEFERVETRGLTAIERVVEQRVVGGEDDRAVLGGNVVGPVGGLQARRGGYVLSDDRRIARNMARQMAGEKARIGVVAAAGTARDHHADLLAGVIGSLGSGVADCARSCEHCSEKNAAPRVCRFVGEHHITAIRWCSWLRAAPAPWAWNRRVE